MTNHKVTSRDGKELGHTTGGKRQCKLEGCLGIRLGVRWDKKTLTWPCTRSMTMNTKQEYQIS